MKPGDIVEKFGDSWNPENNGKIGCLIEILSKGIGTTQARVLVDGEIKIWPINLVRLIDENR